MDTNNELYQIAANFRRAIEMAKNAGEFDVGSAFHNFPSGCCADACYLLGHHLLERGIKTYRVCGEYEQMDSEKYWSHAWLKTEDGVIIDITGDQFGDKDEFCNYAIPVYVGEVDDFHDLFDVKEYNVRTSASLDKIHCLDDNRYPNLYKSIAKYI